MADLHTLWTDDNIRLNDVALIYGISREWVRQLFNEIYRVPYTAIKHRKEMAYRKKIEKQKLKRMADLEWRALNLKGHQGKHALAQMLVHDICADLGYEIEVIPATQARRPVLIVNGNVLDISYSSKPHMAGRGKYEWPYWRFANNRSEWVDVDFLVCVANQNPDYIFFIVPKDGFPVGNMLFIRWGKSNYHAASNRYYEYEGAWHLLE